SRSFRVTSRATLTQCRCVSKNFTTNTTPRAPLPLQVCSRSSLCAPSRSNHSSNGNNPAITPEPRQNELRADPHEYRTKKRQQNVRRRCSRQERVFLGEGRRIDGVVGSKRRRENDRFANDCRSGSPHRGRHFHSRRTSQ